MTIAVDLLERHVQTLVADNAQWQTLIADDLLWELVYAPSLGHPARLSGREEVMRHVTWFLGAVENFR
ncbi:MAG: nuclear transport factor 2 family protein, partial [Candidatus Entotheonellia bacterium]